MFADQFRHWNDSGGLLLVHKPPGITSAGCLNRLKFHNQLAFTKKKIGHTGTLDQFAEGLLVCPWGSFTSFADHFNQMKKVYQAEFIFGIGSDTLDPNGQLYQSDLTNSEIVNRLNSHDVAAAIKRLTGQLNQVPPDFSAKKINGRRASDLVRQGVTVKLKPKLVSVQWLEYNILAAGEDDNTVRVQAKIEVSSGTYIRALARDLGQILAVPCHVANLKRLSVGPWQLPGHIDFELPAGRQQPDEDQVLVNEQAGLQSIALAQSTIFGQRVALKKAIQYGCAHAFLPEPASLDQGLPEKMAEKVKLAMPELWHDLVLGKSQRLLKLGMDLWSFYPKPQTLMLWCPQSKMPLLQFQLAAADSEQLNVELTTDQQALNPALTELAQHCGWDFINSIYNSKLSSFGSLKKNWAAKIQAQFSLPS